MDVNFLGRTLQLILAPVVLITGCGILLNGLLTRYTNLTTILRSMAAERLELVMGHGDHDSGPWASERLKEIDLQLPFIKRHHRLAHQSILCIYSCVTALIVAMLLIAVTALTGYVWAVGVTLLVFLIAVSLLLLGLFFTASDVATSERAISEEVDRVLRLQKPDTTA
jgi:hypothetical protein